MIKRTPEQWRALFQAQSDSGLSAKAFCKANKLCNKYFSKRRKELGEISPSPFIHASLDKVILPSPTHSLKNVRVHYRQVEMIFESIDTDTVMTLLRQLP